MLFAEDPVRWHGWTIDILGTDVSEAAVDRARAGIYTQFEVQRGLGVTQMIRWFEESDDGWRVAESAAPQRPLPGPQHPRAAAASAASSTSSCAATSCSTSAPTRSALAFDRLASALAPDGWLMLGAGETVIGQTEKLVADREWRGLYRLAGDGARGTPRRRRLTR